MGPVSAEIEIDVPRERVFAAIADLARRPSFTDHFLDGFHLTRIESSGVGAGARFRLGCAALGLDGHGDRRAASRRTGSSSGGAAAAATGSPRPRSGS